MKICSHCGKEFDRYKASTCSTACTDEAKKLKRLNGWINSKRQEPVVGEVLKSRREYNRSLWFMPPRRKKAWAQ